MLDNLHIENCQSWDNDDIPLSPGVTVIYGPTHSGKSTLLRALRELWYADVGFAALHRKGTKKPVLISCGGAARERGEDSPNAYEVAGERFDKIGKTVPVAVQAKTGIKELEVEDGTKVRLHWADQYTGPTFLVGDDPKTAAGVLGRLIGTDTIYRAEREARSALRKLEAETKIHVTTVKRLDEQAEKYTHVAAARTQFTLVQTTLLRVQEHESTAASAQALLDEARPLVRAIRARSGLAATKPVVWSPVEQGQRRLVRMRALLEAQAKARKAAKKSVPSPVDLAAVKRAERLRYYSQCEYDLRRKMKDLDAALASATKAQKEAEASLSEAWAETEACPLCGQSR